MQWKYFSSFCFSIVLQNVLHLKSKAQGLEEEIISFTGANNLCTRLLGCRALPSHRQLQSQQSTGTLLHSAQSQHYT